MAGIIAIYGLVVSVLISNDLGQETSLFSGFIQLGAGLSVGLAGLAAGFAIGIVGDAGVRGTAQQPRLFVGMILILIFAEVLGMLKYKANSGDWVSADNSFRAVRLDRCSAHELAGRHRCQVLSVSYRQEPRARHNHTAHITTSGETPASTSTWSEEDRVEWRKRSVSTRRHCAPACSCIFVLLHSGVFIGKASRGECTYEGTWFPTSRSPGSFSGPARASRHQGTST